MTLLEPNWNQEKPTWQDARKMCNEVTLVPFAIESEQVADILERLRTDRSNGGALLKAVRVGASDIFDWFASRNRLLENEILSSLLRRNEIKDLLPELLIQTDSSSHQDGHKTGACAITSSSGFNFDNPFLLDGQLAQNLFAGGAYPPEVKIDGRTAKRLATDFCEAVFGQRYEDVCLYTSYEAWTPWFYGIAWDWTAVLFDRRNRTIWILAVTDTD
ncbi:MAG TPA: hypothetical protein VF742_12540 [Terracidiphilus sp.]|jgi:hypothetical protein